MQESLTFDANRRPLEAIHDPSVLGIGEDGWAERVTKCALPFIMMYRPAGAVCSVILGGIKCVQLCRTAYADRLAGDIRDSVSKAAEATGLAGLVAFTYFRPRLGSILSLAYQITTRLYSLGWHAHNGDKKAAAQETANLVRDLVYLASIFCSRSDLILLSLLLQAAMEASEAGQDFYDGRYLEGFTHLALGVIRARAAMPHLAPARREWLGRDLTQAEFDQIIDELSARKFSGLGGKHLDLNHVLAERNIRARLDGLVIDEYRDLTGVAFANLIITNCQFRGAYMPKSLFADTTISRSDFSGADLSDTIFQNTTIHRSHFTQTFFSGARFTSTHFDQCDFGETQFTRALLRQTLFEHCRLPEANFFRARAQNSKFLESDLTNTFLFGAKPGFIMVGGKPHHITRPVIGFLSHEAGMSYFNDLEATGLKKAGAAIVRIPYNPSDLDAGLLDQEVQQGLTDLKGRPDGYASLPQALVGKAVRESQIGRIREMALEAGLECSGFFLPGGADIEPELYGQFKEEQTNTVGNFKRSMMEASIYAVARNQKIPIWGICRGSQALAINSGAQLAQHVENHYGILHDLRPNIDASPEVLNQLEEILGGREILSPSYHHQAVTEAPEGFTALLEHRGVIKLMVSDDGLVLMTQVHPEVFVIWDEWVDQEMEVAIDPKKLPIEEVRRDWRLILAHLLDEEARKPYDPNEYTGHRDRNQHLFSYFVGLAQEHFQRESDAAIDVA